MSSRPAWSTKSSRTITQRNPVWITTLPHLTPTPAKKKPIGDLHQLESCIPLFGTSHSGHGCTGLPGRFVPRLCGRAGPDTVNTIPASSTPRKVSWCMFPTKKFCNGDSGHCLAWRYLFCRLPKIFLESPGGGVVCLALCVSYGQQRSKIIK